MKKLTAFLVAILIIKNISAQISDGDARLAYQQINDAYESTSYYSGSQMSDALKQRMGKWMPKVLYMYLECAYKNYTENSQTGGIRYPVDYKRFCSFKSQADTFFTLIDKATYPQDKYNNMVDVQKYFSDMMVRYKYQESRTPESAVAFLNECARRYARRNVGGQPNVKNPSIFAFTNDAGDESFYRNIRFLLEDGYLNVLVINKWSYKVDRKNTFAVINNDVIDLHNAQPLDVRRNYLRGYINHKLYVYKRKEDLPALDSTHPKKVVVQNNDLFQYVYEGYDKKTGSMNIAANYVQYPILDLFNQTDQFSADHLGERIIEAFNFLLNYYPVLPVNNAPKEETNRPLGF
ncbi:hypothetical protein [Pinibacter aurantiacus]|uniref:DUF5106 domain-containing protein n=1 Tax=Pinibacter aurantiacus TaxID=2851599 RepID=A0A9E2SCH7_9BACT|nr:hypothetical protein [Pinibacter aurantiacus]MBV4360563.1 hypothetical protein [Pinibacter aurantiacus]